MNSFHHETSQPRRLKEMVEDLSPIVKKDKNSLIQHYDKKLQQILQHSNLTFDNIQTPGWSSLVSSQMSDNRRRGPTQEDIMAKLAIINDRPFDSLHKNATVEYTKARLPSQIQAHSSKKYIKVIEESHKKEQSKNASRFNQITIHQHLYLDSKKQLTKRNVQRIIDQQALKSALKFKPTINPKSILLAERRFSRGNKQNRERTTSFRPSAVKKQPPTKNENDVQLKALHSLFYIITNSSLVLNKSNLNIEQVPLPCIRSLESILQEVYMGRQLNWVQFLEKFCAKAKNKKSFFSLLSEWIKRKQIDFNI